MMDQAKKSLAVQDACQAALLDAVDRLRKEVLDASVRLVSAEKRLSAANEQIRTLQALLRPAELVHGPGLRPQIRTLQDRFIEFQELAGAGIKCTITTEPA